MGGDLSKILVGDDVTKMKEIIRSSTNMSEMKEKFHRYQNKVDNKEDFYNRGKPFGMDHTWNTSYYFREAGGHPTRRLWVNENEHNLAKLYQECVSEVEAAKACRMNSPQKNILEHNMNGGGSPYDCYELEDKVLNCYFKTMGPKFVNDMIRVSGTAMTGFRTLSNDVNVMVKEDGPLNFPPSTAYQK